MVNSNTASSGPDENTPLLQSARNGNTTGSQSAPEPRDEETTQSGLETYPRPHTPRLDRTLGIMFSVSLTAGIITYCFVIASVILAFYGQNHYSVYVYPLMTDTNSFLLLIVPILIIVANMVYFDKLNNFFAVVNILIFGESAWLALNYYIILSSKLQRSRPIVFDYCDRSHQETLGGRTVKALTGMDKGCLRWAHAYLDITEDCSTFVIITAFLFLLLAIVLLVQLWKRRPRCAFYSSERGRNGFSINGGRLSLEVAIRWGSPLYRQEESSPEQPSSGGGDVAANYDQAPVGGSSGQ